MSETYPAIPVHNFACPGAWPSHPQYVIDPAILHHVHWRVEPQVREAARRGIFVQLLNIHQDEHMISVHVRGFKRMNCKSGFLFLDEVSVTDYAILKESLVYKAIEDYGYLVWIRDHAHPGLPVGKPNPVSYIRADGVPVLTAAASQKLEKDWYWAKVEALDPLLSSAVKRVIRKLEA